MAGDPVKLTRSEIVERVSALIQGQDTKITIGNTRWQIIKRYGPYIGTGRKDNGFILYSTVEGRRPATRVEKVYSTVEEVVGRIVGDA